MRNMDAASKLFIAHPRVSKDAVDFVLRRNGYTVVADSMQERNIEAIARMHGSKRLYKKNSSDIVWELDSEKDGRTTHLLVAVESQSATSTVMPLRSLVTVTLRCAAWRQTMKDMHNERNELKTSQELMDGVLPGDRMPLILPLTIHFGQEKWAGPTYLQEMQDIPEELRGLFMNGPCNLLSLKNLTPEELSQMPIGPLRAVGKCIKYAKDRPTLRKEIQEDPSFENMPDVAYDVVRIATGIRLKKPSQKEGNNMKKDISEYDQYLLGLGEEKGVKIGEERGVKIGEEKGIKIGEERGEERGIKIGEERGVKLGEERGKALGTAQTVKKYIGKRWKEHVTETQLLKDLKSYFGLNENEARQYMSEALAKV